MASKLTAEQLIIKREIDRINRQIKKAFTDLGSDSRLAMQYANILQGGENFVARDSLLHSQAIDLRTGRMQPIVRYVGGVPQLSTGKASINEFKDITAMYKKLKLLGSMQTVQSAKSAMVAAYEKRNNLKSGSVRGKKAKTAIREEIERYKTNEKLFSEQLAKLYAIEKERGIKLKATSDIKELSKGRWTSDTDFEKMVQIAEDALNADTQDVIKDVFAENQY